MYEFLYVLAEHQRKGIGSALVLAGLAQCKKLGFGAVVVLGHPEYYPHFGFSPAARFGIGCEYEVPEEAFMAVELQPGYLHGLPLRSNIMRRLVTLRRSDDVRPPRHKERA